MKLKVLAVSALFGLSNFISAQYISTELFKNPTGISNEGIVVGHKGQGLPNYLWNPENNTLEVIGGFAAGLGHGGRAVFSGNGNYISGTSESASDPTFGQMSRYNMQTKQWQTLGNAEGDKTGYTKDYSSGYTISADGKTVGGISFNTSNKAIGFIWNEEKGNISLESLNPTRNARVNAISGDGSVVVGYQDMNGPWKASVWSRKADGTYTINKLLLVDPKGNTNDELNLLGEANAVSANGKWIGGKSDLAFPNAWIWSEETGVKDLGTLTTDPARKCYVNSINADGTVVLGFITTIDTENNVQVYTPYIWTEKEGMKDLNEFVSTTLGFDMSNDKLYAPIALSENQKYILAWGAGDNKGKVMRVQLPADFLSTIQVPTVQTKMSIYPNPSSDFFKIDTKETILDVKVYNQTGQVVNVQKMSDNKYNVSALPKGVYIVSVKTATTTQSTKLIIK